MTATTGSTSRFWESDRYGAITEAIPGRLTRVQPCPTSVGRAERWILSSLAYVGTQLAAFYSPYLTKAVLFSSIATFLVTEFCPLTGTIFTS